MKMSYQDYLEGYLQCQMDYFGGIDMEKGLEFVEVYNQNHFVYGG
jgi:hypothetical protein